MEASGRKRWAAACIALTAGLAVSACARSGPGPSPANLAATAPAGPPNAPVDATAAIPLDPAQRTELAAAVSKAGATRRKRLRYALALGDDGKRYLVVYDGGDSQRAGKGYDLPPVLNRTDGSHYDPRQNEMIAPIPVPKERDISTPTGR